METIDLCDDSDDEGHCVVVTAGPTCNAITPGSPVITKDVPTVDDRCSNTVSTYAVDGTTTVDVFAMPKIDATFSFADNPNLANSIGTCSNNLSIGLRDVPASSSGTESNHSIIPKSSSNYPESSESMESPEATELLQVTETSEPLPTRRSVPSVESPESPSSEAPELLILVSPGTPESPALESPESPVLESPESPVLESPESPTLESPESPQEPLISPETPATRSTNVSATLNIGRTGVENRNSLEALHENQISETIEFGGCDNVTDITSDVEVEPTGEQDPLAGITSEIDDGVEVVRDSDDDLELVPSFNCLYCNFTTNVEHFYHTHLKGHLPGSKPYMRLYCPECDYTTGTRHYLLFHRYKKHKVVIPDDAPKLASRLKSYRKKKKKDKDDVVKNEIVIGNHPGFWQV